MPKLRTAVLVARQPGYHLLEHLLQHPQLDLVCVATHRYLPKAEAPDCRERPEYQGFVDLCQAQLVPCIAANARPLAKDLDFLTEFAPIDLLVSLSWRYILSAKALAHPRLGAINLHRGALPEFAGAEPVRRMLEAGCRDAVITAHLMVETVDAGDTLATVHLPMCGDGVEKVKTRLVPLYPKLFDVALEALLNRLEQGPPTL